MARSSGARPSQRGKQPEAANSFSTRETGALSVWGRPHTPRGASVDGFPAAREWRSTVTAGPQPGTASGPLRGGPNAARMAGRASEWRPTAPGGLFLATHETGAVRVGSPANMPLGVSVVGGSQHSSCDPITSAQGSGGSNSHGGPGAVARAVDRASEEPGQIISQYQ
jgi:hypothetical protein